MDRRIFLKTAAGTVCVSAANPFLRELVAATKTPGFSSVPALFGADYYPDQTPETLWKTDAQMMAEFGITNVRIAEFAWALMEPAQGKFDFGWLHRSVDILNAEKIAVILGTPSAAPPPWLTQKYPEVMMVDEHGMTLSTEGAAVHVSYEQNIPCAFAGDCHGDGEKFCEYPGCVRVADRQ